MSLIFQAVPEARLPLVKLDKDLNYHGLTREEMQVYGLRWLESIKLESPHIYNLLIYDPPKLKTRIASWDFAFNLALEVDYAARRNWNDFLALREIVQNALDIEDRIYGYNNIAIAIFEDELGIHVCDRGPGLPLNSWIMGGGEKECWERGKFGEGLKMAAAQFLRSNIGLYVITINPKTRNPVIYKTVAIPPIGLVVLVIGKPVGGPKVGYNTEFIIYGAKLSPGLLEHMLFQNFLRKHPEAKVVSVVHTITSYCSVPRPLFIVDGVPDMLWVADIYVNKISEIVGRPALFSYNLWYVELDPNRITLSPNGRLEMMKNVVHAFRDEKALSLLLDKSIDYYELEVKSGFFETSQIQWGWYCFKRQNEIVASILRRRNIEVYTTDAALRNFAEYVLGKPVLLSTQEFSGLLSDLKEAKEAMLEDKMRRRKLAGESTVSIEDLTINERGVYRAIHLLISAICDVYRYPTPMIEICEMMGNAIGMANIQDNTIWIKRSLLNPYSPEVWGVLLHELAHLFSRGADLSEAFQREFTKLAGQVAWLLTKDWALLLAMKRAMYYGCFNAKRELDDIIRSITKDVAFNLESIVENQFLNIVRAGDFFPWILVIDTHTGDVMGYYVPEEYYFAFTPKESLSKIREIVLNEAYAFLEKVKAERGHHRLLLFIYDPLNDVYEEVD